MPFIQRFFYKNSETLYEAHFKTLQQRGLPVICKSSCLDYFFSIHNFCCTFPNPNVSTILKSACFGCQIGIKFHRNTHCTNFSLLLLSIGALCLPYSPTTDVFLLTLCDTIFHHATVTRKCKCGDHS